MCKKKKITTLILAHPSGTSCVPENIKNDRPETERNECQFIIFIDPGRFRFKF